ncbi:hypothetical protein O181_040208 [Austropuccinia psidii MF-1]|uniref:Uncharacterized protein n=1 Tax=Austropuccinia psidii MF-1 TaxID=1389203 RepID=A0A9Q3DEW9_9BASI|nr:hypothetical protein [Austropuccinia psidii MF-1]
MGIAKTQENFLRYLSSLPPGENPFPLAQKYAEEQFASYYIPTWSSWLTLVMIFIVISQSSYILYVLISTKSLRIGSITLYRVWKVDTVCVSPILALCYCTFGLIETIPELISAFPNAIISLNRLFIAFFNVSNRCFIWLTFLHAVSIYGPIKSRQTLATWPLNVSFWLPLIIVTVIIFWECVGIYKSVGRVETAYHRLRLKLQEASTSFDPSTYNVPALFEIMLAAKGFGEIGGLAFKHIQKVIVIYLSVNICLLIMYPPLVIVSLSDLRLKIKVLAMVEPPKNVNRVEWIEEQKQLESTQKSILYRFFSVFLAIVCWVGFSVWAYRRFSLDLQALEWVKGSILDNIIPVMSLNINLLVLAHDSSKTLKRYRKMYQDDIIMTSLRVDEECNQQNDSSFFVVNCK